MQQIDFYRKTYCPLNMFQAPLCPSSGAQELRRWLLPVVHGALVLQVFVLVWSCKLCIWLPGCCSTVLSNIPQAGPDQRPVKPQHHVPQAAIICITLELLMMGIMVPETC